MPIITFSLALYTGDRDKFFSTVIPVSTAFCEILTGADSIPPEQNKLILTATQKYIESTKRFD